MVNRVLLSLLDLDPETLAGVSVLSPEAREFVNRLGDLHRSVSDAYSARMGYKPSGPTREVILERLVTAIRPGDANAEACHYAVNGLHGYLFGRSKGHG